MNVKSEIGEYMNQEHGKLVGYARKRLRSHRYMDAEDIIQDVALNLLSKPDINAPLENLAGYIYRSIKNKIIDLSRRKENKKLLRNGNDEKAMNIAKETVPDHQADIQSKVESNEFNFALMKALDILPDDQREIWMLSELDGKKISDIAKEWKVPVGTLLARKHRANIRLRKELKMFINESKIK